MSPNDPAPAAITRKDIPWSLFVSTGIAVLLPLHFLSYGVIHTEGEVMQSLFKGLTVILAVAAAVLAVRSRKHASVLVVGMGGTLLIWQSYQIRKWTMIHEEVVRIIRHVEQIRQTTGSYPDTIKGYSFKNAGMKQHINGYHAETSGFRLSYFMNHTGTSYWYNSNGGFDYYPD